MKVWLVAIAFLICACASSTNSDVQSAAKYLTGDPQQKLKTPPDVEVRLAAVSDSSELAAKIEALEKQLDTLEDQIASGALRGPQGEQGPKGNDGAQGPAGAAASSGSLWSGDPVYYSDLERCISDVFQEVKNLDIDHGYFDETESARAEGWGHTHGLSNFMNSHDIGGWLSVPSDCKY